MERQLEATRAFIFHRATTYRHITCMGATFSSHKNWRSISCTAGRTPSFLPPVGTFSLIHSMSTSGQLLPSHPWHLSLFTEMSRMALMFSGRCLAFHLKVGG